MSDKRDIWGEIGLDRIREANPDIGSNKKRNYSWKIGPTLTIPSCYTNSEWEGPRTFYTNGSPGVSVTLGDHNWGWRESMVTVHVGFVFGGVEWWGRGVSGGYGCSVRLHRGKPLASFMLASDPDLDGGEWRYHTKYLGPARSDESAYWIGGKKAIHFRNGGFCTIGPQVRLSHRNGEYLHYTLDDCPILVARKFDDGWRFGHSQEHIMTQKLLAA